MGRAWEGVNTRLLDWPLSSSLVIGLHYFIYKFIISRSIFFIAILTTYLCGILFSFCFHHGNKVPWKKKRQLKRKEE